MSDKIKTKTLFDHLNAICKKTPSNYWETLSDSDKKSWNTFMILKYLSMNPMWVSYIDDIQRVAHTLTDEQCFKFLYNTIPQSKAFLKFVSSKNKTKVDDWIVDYVSLYYNESKSTADEYVQILFNVPNGIDEVKRIIRLYGVEENKIKKIDAKR